MHLPDSGSYLIVCGLFLSELFRRQARQAAEETGEISGISKPQSVGDLTDILYGINQAAFSFQKHSFMNHLQRTFFHQLLANVIQVGGGDTQLCGIAFNFSMAMKVAVNQRHELVKILCTATLLTGSINLLRRIAFQQENDNQAALETILDGSTYTLSEIFETTYDGFDVYGGFSHPTEKIVWWSEGIAEYVAQENDTICCQ